MNYIQIAYSYINQLINSEKLLDLLTNIEKDNFNNEEIKELNKIIIKLKEIIKNVPIVIDEIEEIRNKMIEKNINYLEKVKYEDKELEKYYNSLIEERNEKRDSGPRYEETSKLLVNNKLYKNLYNELTNSEKIELLTKFIKSPSLPIITKEKFDELVQTGIKENKREALWRLAYNYNNCNMDFTSIIDFYIKERDTYYIIELLCAVEEEINKIELIDKIFKTKDKKFINNCAEELKQFEFLNKEQLKILLERLK